MARISRANAPQAMMRKRLERGLFELLTTIKYSNYSGPLKRRAIAINQAFGFSSPHMQEGGPCTALVG
jgi:hypothetical protein